MPTNPIPTDSVNFSVNLSKDLRKRLDAIAEAAGMKPGEYARELITLAVEKKLLLKKSVELEIPKAAEDPAIYPSNKQ